MKVFVLITCALFVNSVLSQESVKASIDSILEPYGSTSAQPGLTVGVVKDGKLIYHQSKGFMNLEYDVPFNDSTIFGLASVTKQFTSACIGVLEKQNRLSVNDDIRKYIPEMSYHKDTIRIKHLLNHTSGIRNHNVLLDLKGFDYNHQGYTNETIEKLTFQQNGVNNIPGEKMLYANTNYVLLALIVERVSGMKIHKFARQELFVPLGMNNTFFKTSLEQIVKNRAYSYYHSNGEFRQPKSLSLCVGAGGMASTINDLSKWSKVFLNPKHKFNYLANFITQLDTLNNGTIMKHARGMFVSPYKGHKSFNHSGRDLGMRSQFICLPDQKNAVIVFTNSEDINAVNVSYQVLDLFVKEKSSLKLKEKPYKHSLKKLKKLEGVYQEFNSDLRMNVFVENDTLKALSSFGRIPTSLRSVGQNSFCRSDNPSVQYHFCEAENGDVHLNVDFGGAIFYFEEVELESNPNENLSDYVGEYYSQELNVTYEISLKSNSLVLNFPTNKDLVLKEGVKETFGANRRTKYAFKRDEGGKIISFEVSSEGTVKDILFEKVN